MRSPMNTMWSVLVIPPCISPPVSGSTDSPDSLFVEGMVPSFYVIVGTH